MVVDATGHEQGLDHIRDEEVLDKFAMQRTLVGSTHCGERRGGRRNGIDKMEIGGRNRNREEGMVVGAVEVKGF